MARDRGLEEWVGSHLEHLPGLTEKPMFGGWAWLLDGHLLCCARSDGVLVRLGKGLDDWALDRDGIEPMISGGRAFSGWVRVSPEGMGDDALVQTLIDASLAFVRSLPAKE